MSIRTKVLGLVDVMMRVPPILVIDEILKISMGLPTRFYPANTDNGNKTGLYNTTEFISAALKNTSILTNSTIDNAIDNISVTAIQNGVLSGSFNVLMDEFAQDTNILSMLSLTSIRFVICFIGFLCAASIFMLWTRHLVMVYMFIISLGLTFFSYWLNVSALAVMEKRPCMLEDLISLNTTRLLETSSLAMTLFPHLVAQWFMGTLFAYIHLGPRYILLQKYMPLIFASPILCAVLPLPPRFIGCMPAIADSVPLLLSKITLLSSAMEAGKTVYNGYQYSMNFVSNFGLSSLIENEWQRLNVPSVLRVFWTIRITQEFVSMIMSDNVSDMSLLPTIQKLLVDGCETLTAVLGMTSVISIICHYIGKAFQWYLLTFDSDEEKSLGTVAAVLFYVLALQTGLTSLSPDKRFVRLCRNVYLLVTALLHFLHNIVSPILMSLSAARNPSRKRHIRALSVCFFLVAVSSCLLISLWSRQTPSTWLLAVTAFSIEVIVKVFVSLATYTLFLLDARRQTFWEKLDDYLYYVRAFGNSVEFCFGILLFFNGAWILLFESGGAIRAIMMCIHAYFNIWCEARAGWSVFMKRRSAVHKISTLPEATAEQLRAFDDVCAICYQEMYSAKITRCRHFFHGVCLRKWLYVQDRCPLCHEIMMYTDKDEVRDRTQAITATSSPSQIHSRDDDTPHQIVEHLNTTVAVSISTQTPSRHAEVATASNTSITASLFSTSSSISSTITSGSSFPAYPTVTSTALPTAAVNNITTTGAISAATDAADQD